MMKTQFAYSRKQKFKKTEIFIKHTTYNVTKYINLDKI